MVTIIETKKELSKYQNTLKSNFEAHNPEYITVTVSSRGGSSETEVMYFKKQNIWVVFSQDHNRYWNAFGVGKPIEGENLSIVCEINFPFDGLNRRIGGAFGKENGEVVLLHRGKIGGGRKGIGKNLFIENYRGKYLSVLDGDVENYIAIIGMLNSTKIISQVAVFVHEVQRIKNLDIQEIENNPDEEDNEGGDISTSHFEFKEERFGKNSYLRKDEIEAICNHGIIVNELAKYLKSTGVEVGNDRKRDLFTIKHGSIDRIFEIKTDLSNSSIYSAVGQILIYSIEKNLHNIEKILVLPEKLKNSVEGILAKLGLQILYYSFENEIVTFIKIKKILKL